MISTARLIAVDGVFHVAWWLVHPIPADDPCGILASLTPTPNHNRKLESASGILDLTTSLPFSPPSALSTTLLQSCFLR